MKPIPSHSKAHEPAGGRAPGGPNRAGHAGRLAALALLSCLICPGMEAAPAPATLKDAYGKYFHVGVAVNRSLVTDTPVHFGNVNRGSEQIEKDIALVDQQFDQISPENDLKWERIQPRPGADGYDFGPADAYVNFGLNHHMYIVGHTLVWHSQTPDWVFAASGPPSADGRQPPASREELLQRMHDHIAAVVGRYKGKIKVWDVVNEAVADHSTNVLRDSPWLQIIGPDFIAKAFEFAHEADPDAILRYNDYALEDTTKRHKLITLIRSLQKQHVPVMAIGSQTHVNVSSPSFEIEDETLRDLERLGLPIHITELDVNGAEGGQRNTAADVAGNGRTTQGGLVDNASQRLADEYTALFSAFVKHRKSVKVVTFWGVNDGVSWRAAGHPLLFDANDEPKPAFDAVIKVGQKYHWYKDLL
jgi:endo-1,4-beta-xylanase